VMSKFLIVFAAVLACMVCAHEVPVGEGINVLTLSNMSLAHTGDWLLVLYAPWCYHCKNLLEKIPDVAAEIKKLDGTTQIGLVNADAEPAIQMQFSMHGFPSIFMAHDGEVYEYPSSLGRAPETLAQFVVKDYSKETPITGYKAPFGLIMRAFGLYSAFAIATYRFLEVYAEKLNIPPMWFFGGVAVLFAIVVIVLMIVVSRCRQPKKCAVPRKSNPKKEKADAAIAAPIVQQERVQNPTGGAAIAETEKVQEKVKKAKKEQELRRRDKKKDDEALRDQQKEAQKKSKNSSKGAQRKQQNRPTQQPSKRS